ncbi:DUF1127 domain-containing protein [Vibrio hangzhouensis]|uniref:YjiS-like domain-containing protein n=1 Tax=Vibrio hangzhouensis TaxID=462991 RepID=A0A1H5UI76_9VIBR|nr:DUF1127 domain-containing protein [Vibrio hangzhouensis]SEF74765.1 protein of unknown function [Vibrio hangzhouensis]
MDTILKLSECKKLSCEHQSIGKKFLIVVRQWHQNYRSRKALAELSDHLLDDIGVTRAEAREESQRNFWNRQ